MISQEQPHRTSTIINAKGYYTGHDIKVIIVVTRQREASYVYRMIDDIDPDAFVRLIRLIGLISPIRLIALLVFISSSMLP